MTHNFETPEGRYAAIEALGPDRYNAAHAAAIEASVLETVAGHRLRPVATRFGRLIQVGSTGLAFQTIEQAREHAKANPRDTLAELTDEYQAKLAAWDLPQLSADELLHEDLTPEQRRYVSTFYDRWTAVEKSGL